MKRILTALWRTGVSMLRSLRGNASLMVTLIVGTLAIVLVLTLDGVGLQSVRMAAQTFQSPIQTPTPHPSPTPSAACPAQTRWIAFAAGIEVEGLSGAERAMIRMKPADKDITVCLEERGVVLPESALGNGRHRIQLQEIPDGAYYRLEVQGPPSFLRSPAAYLFQVQDGQILRRPGYTLQFQLVPPAKQELPPCREFEKRFTPPITETPPRVGDIPADTQEDVCQAEGTIDLSAPPKQPEGSRGRSVASTGYHYIGPVTT